MKKILGLCVALPILIICIFAFSRIGQNQTSIVPYPFIFGPNSYQDLSINDAPILIIGDRMADRLASFKDRLAEKLSKNLSKPIKIKILSNEGDSIHRTLKKLKTLKRMPLIIIYVGNTDQSYESSFLTKNIMKANSNFKIYENDLIQTLLMIYPKISKLVYWPVNYVGFSTKVNKDELSYTDDIYQKRLALNYTLYESALNELLNLVSKRSSLIIPLTTPINLQNPPTKSCYGTLTGDANQEIDKLKKVITKKDYKEAYNLSKELSLFNPSNSQILYLHSQVSRKMNKFKEAQKYGELAVAFDCANKRANPIYNEILKKLTKKYRFNYLDFHQLIQDQTLDNYGFIDDIYPQDVFIEKVVDLLAIKIKKRLKL